LSTAEMAAAIAQQDRRAASHRERLLYYAAVGGRIHPRGSVRNVV